MPSEPPDSRHLKSPEPYRNDQFDATRAVECSTVITTSLHEHHSDTLGFKNVPGYEVVSVLGSGACGIVFKAKQLKLERIVALKTVALDRADTANLVARFEKEAMALARLQHPNIVNVFDSGRHEGRLYFAMELLQGQDLGDRLDKTGAVDEITAWSIARQTASALAHAAAAGIIHRDIKPANLYLVTPPTGYPLPPGVPMVKVTDFGLALSTDAGSNIDSGHRLTHVGTVVGTPIYMAPEQFSKPDIDSQADIYALGATVYHMLEGVIPYDGKTIWDLMTKKSDPTPPAFTTRISQSSVDLVIAMMQPDADRRIGSYPELLSRIDALLLDLDSARTAAFPMRRPGRPRKKWLLPAAVGFCAVVAGIIVLFNRTSGPSGIVATKPTVREKYISEGKSLALYNGRDLSNWRFKGIWGFDEDPTEGGKKIIGSGTLRTQFDHKPPFRIALGIDLNDPEAEMELLTCRTRGPADQAIHTTLKITRKGAQLGRRTGDERIWEPFGATVPYPITEKLGDSAAYLHVEIEALGDLWIARFHGREVGAIPDDRTQFLSEVCVTTNSGKVRIESAILEGLKKVE